ncbi:plasmid partitioning protein RepB [Pseudochrobactrum sp. MP213Fo]|uniref:plasmid partitioning protein RepB n=1 Tax=Pseudochrobactrum sp. MP213Fo TaxID=3022250 RepID=UPI003B9E64DB
MNSRKNQLKALFGAPPPEPKPVIKTEDQPETHTHSETEAVHTNTQHQQLPPQLAQQPAYAPQKPAEPAIRSAASRSGAVKAMGLSLADMSRELETAKQLSKSLAKGDQIVELDAALIDGSFVEDRLTRQETDDPEFLSLIQSLHQHGQQVPILVRPHPETPGRFQAAYGHRRMRAAARLGLPVKALIKQLSDTELVLAQGKENSERRNLSFIERALFAQSLIERGFDRSMVQDALSLHKAEMTRFLQVASSVPEQIIRAIGPAPKVGRPRWMQLAETLKDKNLLKRAQTYIAEHEFKDAESDMRFQLILNKLSLPTTARSEKLPERSITSRNGERLGKYFSQQGRAHFDLQHRDAQGFATYLAEQLPELYDKFCNTKDK